MRRPLISVINTEAEEKPGSMDRLLSKFFIGLILSVLVIRRVYADDMAQVAQCGQADAIPPTWQGSSENRFLLIRPPKWRDEAPSSLSLLGKSRTVTFHFLHSNCTALRIFYMAANDNGHCNYSVTTAWANGLTVVNRGVLSPGSGLRCTHANASCTTWSAEAEGGHAIPLLNGTTLLVALEVRITNRSRADACEIAFSFSANPLPDISLLGQVTCLPLPAPLHGNTTTHPIQLGKTQQFACSSGYHLGGNSTKVCLASGKWSAGFTPKCDGNVVHPSTIRLRPTTVTGGFSTSVSEVEQEQDHYVLRAYILGASLGITSTMALVLVVTCTVIHRRRMTSRPASTPLSTTISPGSDKPEDGGTGHLTAPLISSDLERPVGLRHDSANEYTSKPSSASFHQNILVQPYGVVDVRPVALEAGRSGSCEDTESDRDLYEVEQVCDSVYEVQSAPKYATVGLPACQKTSALRPFAEDALEERNYFTNLDTGGVHHNVYTSTKSTPRHI